MAEIDEYDELEDVGRPRRRGSLDDPFRHGVERSGGAGAGIGPLSVTDHDDYHVPMLDGGDIEGELDAEFDGDEGESDVVDRTYTDEQVRHLVEVLKRQSSVPQPWDEWSKAERIAMYLTDDEGMTDANVWRRFDRDEVRAALEAVPLPGSESVTAGTRSLLRYAACSGDRELMTVGRDAAFKVGRLDRGPDDGMRMPAHDR